MTAYEIPLTPEAQTFQISLGSKQYRLTFKWNEVSSCWLLDIQDAQDVPLVMGIPVVTGTDLLKQYKYLGFEGQLVVQSQSEIDQIPTYESLGSDGLLFFVQEG